MYTKVYKNKSSQIIKIKLIIRDFFIIYLCHNLDYVLQSY